MSITKVKLHELGPGDVFIYDEKIYSLTPLDAAQMMAVDLMHPGCQQAKLIDEDKDELHYIPSFTDVLLAKESNDEK